MGQLLTERRAAKVSGVLSCLDRTVIIGTLPELSYVKGMASCFYRARDPDPRLRQVGRTAARRDSVPYRVDRGRDRRQDRVHAPGRRPQGRHRFQTSKRGTHVGVGPRDSGDGDLRHLHKPWHDKQTHETYLSGCTSTGITALRPLGHRLTRESAGTTGTSRT